VPGHGRWEDRPAAKGEEAYKASYHALAHEAGAIGGDLVGDIHRVGDIAPDKDMK